MHKWALWCFVHLIASRFVTTSNIVIISVLAVAGEWLMTHYPRPTVLYLGCILPSLGCVLLSAAAHRQRQVEAASRWMYRAGLAMLGVMAFDCLDSFYFFFPELWFFPFGNIVIWVAIYTVGCGINPLFRLLTRPVNSIRLRRRTGPSSCKLVIYQSESLGDLMRLAQMRGDACGR